MANYFEKQGEMKTIQDIDAVRLSAFLLVFLLLGCQSFVFAAAPTSFNIFFSGNVFGEIEACGG